MLLQRAIMSAKLDGQEEMEGFEDTSLTFRVN
jgi:hypothetical protein